MNEFKPIGLIHSPYKKPEGVPIQPVFSDGITAEIEVYPEFQEGLKDLDGFSHIILLYVFHKSKDYRFYAGLFWIIKKEVCFQHGLPRDPIP
jgi:tRNA (Thr-GGU) A37 N-methylase